MPTKPLNTGQQSTYGNKMAKKKGEGFHSAAGLIRYFDEEGEKSPKVNPWGVVAMCIGSTVAIGIATWLWPV